MVTQIIEQSKRHSTRAYYAFSVMYTLGLRVSELSRNRWQFVGFTHLALDTSKNSDIRLFEINDVPLVFIQYLQDQNSRLLMVSRSGLYSVLRKCITEPLPIFTEKSTALHVFRYAYIQNLVSLNLSSEEIRQKLGHKDIKNTNLYLSHLQSVTL